MSSNQPQLQTAQAATGALPERFTRQFYLYLLWLAVTSILFIRPLIAFVRYSLANDNASHLILIPVICAWILFLERRQIFARLGSATAPAAALGVTAAILGVLAFTAGSHWSTTNQLCVHILALVLLWIAGFAFFFGLAALKQAKFPLLFLVLTVPIPDFLLDKTIYLLQKGSAEIAAVLFDWSGVPVLRDGFVFHLARVSIEVARECSGIRSSLALLILAILVAHFYLETFWKQVVLVLAGLFVMILKNGVRIVTLTLLATYVDPDFLYGRLHHQGGVVFFILGLLLMLPLLWLLQRSERKSSRSPVSSQTLG
jgi:exosortase